MEQGTKIRELRQGLGLTQAELAEAAGVGDSTIRGYESGTNAPRRRPLEALAARLGVAPEALVDHGIDAPDAAIQALFELEDGPSGARPATAEDGRAAVSFDGELGALIAEWSTMRGRLDAGEVSSEQYRAWRDRLGLSKG